MYKFFFPALAAAGALVFLAPDESEAFSTNGSSLGLSQRDFRVLDTFQDAAANNNTTPHPNFPGYEGAVVAIWKGCVEWGSRPHGDGSGDPVGNNTLGSGGANFDPSFQGKSTGVGGTNQNVHSPLGGGDGSVLAFAEGPYSDGWRIRYYEAWTWRDGPFDEGSMDLQGVAAHEYGHVIGLGHSTAGGSPTMKGSTSTGTENRSLASDDIAAVQAVYGVASSQKPIVTGLSVNAPAGTVTITGSNFSDTGNEVWFTKATVAGNGNPVKFFDVDSSAGGTSITVSIPTGAGPGDLLVKNKDDGNAALSNAWPIDLEGIPEPPAGATVASLVPTSIPAVVVDGATTLLLNGTGFTGITGINVDGLPLENFPPQYSVLSDNQLRILSFPLVSTIGPVDIELVHPQGNAVTQIDVVVNDPPVLELVGSTPGFLVGAAGLRILVGGDVGDFVFLQFSGDLLPSVAPGFVDFGIGNNFSTLFSLGVYEIPISGYVELDFPLEGDFGGLTLHLQAAVLDASTFPAVFPLVTTNVQTGTFLF